MLILLEDTIYSEIRLTGKLRTTRKNIMQITLLSTIIISKRLGKASET